MLRLFKVVVVLVLVVTFLALLGLRFLLAAAPLLPRGWEPVWLV